MAPPSPPLGKKAHTRTHKRTQKRRERTPGNGGVLGSNCIVLAMVKAAGAAVIMLLDSSARKAPLDPPGRT